MVILDGKWSYWKYISIGLFIAPFNPYILFIIKKNKSKIKFGIKLLEAKYLLSAPSYK